MFGGNRDTCFWRGLGLGVRVFTGLSHHKSLKEVPKLPHFPERQSEAPRTKPADTGARAEPEPQLRCLECAWSEQRRHLWKWQVTRREKGDTEAEQRTQDVSVTSSFKFSRSHIKKEKDTG